MKRKLAFSAIIIGALFTGCSTAPNSEAEVPEPPSGNILDQADVLTNSQEHSLNQLIDRENTETNAARLAILTYDDDRGNVADYASRVGNAWGVGDRSNNGVLIAVDIEHREVFIAVADGVSPTDSGTQEIIDSHIEPNFKNDNYYGGLEKAVTDIYSYAQDGEPASAKSASRGWMVAGILAGILGAILLIAAVWIWVDYRIWARVADREIEEALTKDPNLEITDEIRKAYRSYRYHHRKPPKSGEQKHNESLRAQAEEDDSSYTLYAGSFNTWLPLYMVAPGLYQGPGVSPDHGYNLWGNSSSSSFGGGSGFSGGGAGGSF